MADADRKERLRALRAAAQEQQQQQEQQHQKSAEPVLKFRNYTVQVCRAVAKSGSFAGRAALATHSEKPACARLCCCAQDQKHVAHQQVRG